MFHAVCAEKTFIYTIFGHELKYFVSHSFLKSLKKGHTNIN